MPKKVSFRNSRGQKLAGLLFETPKDSPVVIITHGLSGNKESPGRLRWARSLQEAGFSVLCFDCSGHGESEGSFADSTLTQRVNDLEAAVRYVKNLIGADRIALAGHSLGGTVSMIAASRGAWALASVSAPYDFYRMYANLEKKGMLDLKKWKKEGHIVREDLPRSPKVMFRFFVDVVKYDMSEIAKKVECPVFIGHGKKDEIVSVEQSEQIYRELKCEKKMRVFPGAKHRFEGENLSEMIRETTSFFSSLGSRA